MAVTCMTYFEFMGTKLVLFRVAELLNIHKYDFKSVINVIVVLGFSTNTIHLLKAQTGLTFA